MNDHVMFTDQLAMTVATYNQAIDDAINQCEQILASKPSAELVAAREAIRSLKQKAPYER